MNSFLEIQALYKSFDNGLIHALEDVTLQFEKGKIYALMGASGSGKSTLLNLIGTLDKPTSGTIYYEGKPIESFSNIHEFRRTYIGFVFQFHHLIPVLTLRENIESALLPDVKLSSRQKEERTTELLQKLKIYNRADSYASDVSGGERQRAAIARALANKPKLILADEPTGNVDSKTAKNILNILKEYNSEHGSTVIIATHDQNIAKIADVVIMMQDGRITSVKENKEIKY